GSSVAPAADGKLRPKLSRSLCHDLEAEVPRLAPFTEHSFIDSDTVVANSYREGPVREENFGFDSLGVRVSKRIEQCLAANSEDLLEDQGVQALRSTELDDTKLRTILLRQLVTQVGQCLADGLATLVFGAKVQNSLAAFRHDLIREPQGVLQLAANRISFGQLIRRIVDGQQHTLDVLKKCIVKIARNALTLVQSHLQSSTQVALDAVDSKSIQNEHCEQRGTHTQQGEPGGLIELRRNTKCDGGLCVSPRQVA